MNLASTLLCPRWLSGCLAVDRSYLLIKHDSNLSVRKFMCIFGKLSMLNVGLLFLLIFVHALPTCTLVRGVLLEVDNWFRFMILFYHKASEAVLWNQYEMIGLRVID